MKKTSSKKNVGTVETVETVDTSVETVETVDTSVETVETVETVDTSVETVNTSVETVETVENKVERLENNGNSNRLNSLLKSIAVFDSIKNKSTMAIALCCSLICKHHKDEIKKNYNMNASEYICNTFDFAKSTVSLYCKVAERFIVAKNNDLVKAIAKCDSATSIALLVTNETHVTALTDVYGYEFSLAQLQELLPIKEIEKIQELIDNEEITSCMSTKKIRDVVKSKISAIDTTATVTEPTATVTEPTATVTESTATVTEPTATDNSSNNINTDNMSRENAIAVIAKVLPYLNDDNAINQITEILNSLN